ncbi:hypothetical protein V6N11_024170 [Hibiscus sabdariffa]|uniref:Uncharacterized protein n=2 Tax=Hibiscus sabdariffa TaxID=183260 RepID=A0ABR2GDK3_9ROSI
MSSLPSKIALTTFALSHVGDNSPLTPSKTRSSGDRTSEAFERIRTLRLMMSPMSIAMTKTMTNVCDYRVTLSRERGREGMICQFLTINIRESHQEGGESNFSPDPLVEIFYLVKAQNHLEDAVVCPKDSMELAHHHGHCNE